MQERFDPTRNAYLTVDDDDIVREISHRPRPVVTPAPTVQAANQAYIQSNLALLQIQPAEIANLSLAAEAAPIDAGSEYRIADEKTFFDVTTTEYEQTYFGLPVRGAGLAVHVKHDPYRVIGSTFTGRKGIHVDKPDGRVLRKYETITTKELMQFLGLRKGREKATIDASLLKPNGSRLVIYRYDAETRLSDHEDHPIDDAGGPPVTHRVHASHHQAQDPLPPFAHPHFRLPIPDVDDAIEDGRHYVAAEIHFSLGIESRPELNWRMYVEIETGSILYIRALVDNVDGMVFTTDPARLGSAATPTSNNATLNPLRTSVTLQGLSAPTGGIQSLTGTWIAVTDHENPTVAPPTQATGNDFNYNVRTNNFAAVNCYYHCDAFFRLVADLGFNVANYFDGTTFPISVDHRGRFGTADGIEVNASCGGNATGNGIGQPDFELMDLADTTNPLGMAANWPVTLHEFGGHGILWDHVNSANFGFAHSAGDSFAVILNDPGSQAPDRFQTFPFLGARRHDRAVGAGWAWGGSNDTGGYNSEQILSTTMFRIYRSLGGDSTRIEKQRFAARYMAYLMLRAVATLTPATNPANATGFANAMLAADLVDWTAKGYAGGAFGKVIRWAFEKQGMYQPPGAPTPVATVGAPPAVDVYIDDGRAGEYQYLGNHWSCQNIWNRVASDGGTTHQTPIVGVANYAYVKIKNRGTQNATNVVVKGYHCNPGTGLTWPNDWQPMTTAQIAAPDVAANNAAEITVGPFEWVPSQLDHECMLMIVSADGDPSNIDNFSAGDTISESRLVPHDNNIGQRNVSPEAGGGGLRGLMGSFPKKFLARNPFPKEAGFEFVPILPDFLVSRGYELVFANPGGSRFSMAAGQSREIVLQLKAGADFSPQDVASAEDPAIHVEAYGDGMLVGGMSYKLDPRIEVPPSVRPAKDPCANACRKQATRLLDCLDLPDHQVKSVKVRKITLDIEIEDDRDCC